MLSHVYVLSCMEFSRHVASGFEVPFGYNPAKRQNDSANYQHHTISDVEAQSSKSSSSRCKYDLGLGKNGPLQTNCEGNCIDRQIAGEQERRNPNTAVATAFEHNYSTCGSPYEACRFLVEHEATRMYPSPNDNCIADFVAMDSEDKSLANSFPIAARRLKTTLRPSSSSVTTVFASNGKQDRNANKHESAREKIRTATTTTTNKSVPTASIRPRKAQHPVKVEPKRFLEDCLTILDHELSDSSGASSGNSIIWSRPDTPQLDMNSVWVEMMLHNQMVLSRTQG